MTDWHVGKVKSSVLLAQNGSSLLIWDNIEQCICFAAKITRWTKSVINLLCIRKRWRFSVFIVLRHWLKNKLVSAFAPVINCLATVPQRLFWVIMLFFDQAQGMISYFLNASHIRNLETFYEISTQIQFLFLESQSCSYTSNSRLMVKWNGTKCWKSFRYWLSPTSTS